MDISLAYDSRTASSGDFTTRAVLAPQYMLNQQYNGSTTMIATQQQQVHQNNPFSFAGYTGAHSVVPAFTGYIQQRPLPPLVQTANDGRSVQYSSNSRQGFVETQLSQSPPIKHEPHWNFTPTSTSSSSTVPLSNSKEIKPAVSVNGAPVIDFCTEVDTLMKAIQAQKEPSNPPLPTPVVGASFTPPHTHSDSRSSRYSSGESSSYLLTDENCQDDTAIPKKASKKRYPCTVGNCSREFYQKTHLDIHVRSHTGEKPYSCKHAGCDRHFSQLGNLKTHERRHTGERPYPCDLCGKRFAQRGNVRQHKTIHGQAKPYPCKLEDGTGKECGKLFTQLGNLKSHQNKFHVVALRNLTTKFASIKNGDVSEADRELHDYFRELYKNSNKGIKGRGKQRKVGPDSTVLSGMNNLALEHNYGLNGAGRGNMVVSVMHDDLPPLHLQGRMGHGRYEICEVDDGSQTSHSGSGSGSGYDDVHSDNYNSPNSDLAFGDRIY